MRYHPIAALAPAFFSPAHIQKCIDRNVLAFPIQAIHCIACMGNAVHSKYIWVHGRLSLTVQHHTIWTFLGFFGITLHFVGFWGISSKALELIWIMCHYLGGTCFWDALTPRPPTERVSWIKFVSFLDAIAPTPLIGWVSEWVSESVTFSDFGDCYRIYRACELVL